MEFGGDQQNSHAISGSTISGAIFMCNRRTMKECYKRELFGLPTSQAIFVKKIKTGMTLFLFEHEERKLYGVFGASSDGAMNIVPEAFKSSGKQFPAQVRVRLLRDCDPLAERDFRDALKENYYTAQKFRFDLSENQVYKLRSLFRSRKKLNIQQSENITTNTKAKKNVGKSGLGKVRVTEKCRFVTTDRAETSHGMDNGLVPVNRTRLPPSPSANQTSIFADSGKLVIERGDPSIEGSHRSSLTLPHSVEPRLLDLLCSTSHGKTDRDDPSVEGSHRSSLTLPYSVEPRLSDLLCSTSHGKTDKQHVITPFSDSYLSRDSSFHYRQPQPFAVTDHGTPASDHALYSNTSTDSLFPQSRSQLITFSTRYHIPDAISNLRDYIPLNTEIQIPEYGYLGDKSINNNKFEGYDNRLPFRQPSLATMPISSNEKFERANMTSFDFSSDKEPSPVSDLDYVSGGLRYWKYEPATGIIPLSSDGKSHSQLVSYPKESRSIDLYDGHGYEYPTNCHDDYKSQINLRFDSQRTRTSVFSRLTEVNDTIGQDQNYIVNTDMDMSVNHHVTVLQQDQKRSRRGMKKPKESFGWNVDHDDYDKITEIKMGEVADLVNEKSSERKGGTPLVNFKRRSEIRKRQGEIQMEGCVIAFEGESLSVTSGKRRKLVRPSFGFEELSCDKGTVSEEGSEGNQNEISQNDAQKNGKNGKAVKSSNQESSKGEGVSEGLGAGVCLFNVKVLVQDAQVSTGDHVEIAEKGSSRAQKELGDGSVKSETTEVLVDDGGCKGESNREEQLPASECEPKQRVVRRVKTVKRVKKNSSNPPSV